MAPAAAAAAPVEIPERARVNPLWIVAAIIAAMLVANWLVGPPRYIW
jgi:hypothetical protein